MAEVTGKALDWKLLGRVMHYVKPYRLTFIIAGFLTVFLAGNAAFIPVVPCMRKKQLPNMASYWVPGTVYADYFDATLDTRVELT